jgi:hypothetical protein
VPLKELHPVCRPFNSLQTDRRLDLIKHQGRNRAGVVPALTHDMLEPIDPSGSGDEFRPKAVLL